MITLPRLSDPNTWRQRRDAAKRQRKSTAYCQRMMELSVAKKIEESMSIIDATTLAMRAQIEMVKRELDHHLEFMITQSSGWSHETLPMLRMETDAAMLRRLAERMDETRRFLTTPHLIAAE